MVQSLSLRMTTAPRRRSLIVIDTAELRVSDSQWLEQYVSVEELGSSIVVWKLPIQCSGNY